MDFSFSGLKTAALKVVRDLGAEAFAGDPQLLADSVSYTHLTLPTSDLV